MANKYNLAEQENILESGNELAAIAAAQINYHVMGYYPITPSTQIAEYLDEMKANGRHTVLHQSLVMVNMVQLVSVTVLLLQAVEYLMLLLLTVFFLLWNNYLFNLVLDSLWY